jgi:hypothetical protein
MFSDPLQLHLFDPFDSTGNTPESFPAIERAADHSAYKLLDWGNTGEDVTIFVGHQFSKRNRTTVRFTLQKVIADPISGSNVLASNSYYFVADKSPIFSPSQESKALGMLGSFLLGIDTDDPLVTRVMAGET